MKLEAAVIQGDGVGPEMMEEAVRCFRQSAAGSAII